jgi:hypothetical protein
MQAIQTDKATPAQIDAYLRELRELRDSGEINMWGAAPYLMDEFGMGRMEARDALLAWIASFRVGM